MVIHLGLRIKVGRAAVSIEATPIADHIRTVQFVIDSIAESFLVAKSGHRSHGERDGFARAGWLRKKGMIHGIAVAAASTRMPARSTASVNGRALSALAMACLFLTGCASPGAVSSPVASDQNPPAKVDAAMTRAAGTGTGTGVGPSGAVAQDPVLLQRRRQAIAEMLEGNITYRTLFDVKLTDAKLAGPYVVVHRNLFSGSAYEDRYYCARANLDIWPIPYPRTAVVRVKQAENGSEYLRAAIGVSSPPSECSGITNYVPFPEMEQLRARRRQALGKAD